MIFVCTVHTTHTLHTEVRQQSIKITGENGNEERNRRRRSIAKTNL